MSTFADAQATGLAEYNARVKERDDALAQVTALKAQMAAQTQTTPTPPAAADHDGLLQVSWHHGWSGPNLSAYPADVRAGTDMIIWAMAQSGGKGTGTLAGPPLVAGYPQAAAVKDIAAYVSEGRDVLIGIGGSNDGGITVTTDAQADQAKASIDAMVNAWGFTGISLDLEPSGGKWAQPALVRLCKALKATHGPGFHIDVCVALYDPWTAGWVALGKALGDAMDTMSVMVYDFPEAGDGRLTGASLDKVATLNRGGVSPAKVVLLYMMRPTATYANSTPDAGMVVAALKSVLAKYPTLRGFGWWEDQINAARNWDGPRAVTKAALV